MNNRTESGSTDNGGNSRGFALMIVIVIMLLASFLASQLVMKARTELLILHNIKARSQGAYLAEAGTNMSIFRLFDKPIDIPDFGEEEEWLHFFEGFNYEFFLPMGRVTYYAVSESGKIDLNKSPMGLIKLFLMYQLGCDEDDERLLTITDSLQDWRDTDDLHRLSGAESEYYQELDDPYIARNGKIEDPSEFFLINGTEELVGKFDAMDVFTVYNSKRTINFNSLTPAMLDFVSGGNKEAVTAYRDAKKEYSGKIPRTIFSEILGEERDGEIRTYLTNSTGTNKYYYVVGTGQLGVVESDALEEEKPKKVPGSKNSILLKKRGSAAYTILAWQERYI